MRVLNIDGIQPAVFLDNLCPTESYCVVSQYFRLSSSFQNINDPKVTFSFDSVSILICTGMFKCWLEENLAHVDGERKDNFSKQSIYHK